MIKVIFLAVEAAPFVKVGGLGDVAGSLPPTLRSLSQPINIRQFLPLYPFLSIEKSALDPIANITVRDSNKEIAAEIFHLCQNGIKFYFISGEPIANTNSVYSDDGYQDGRKFTFFSLAALELARKLDWQPDILHTHDWHTSPAIYKLHLTRDQDPFFKHTSSLLTVHNLPYQGHGAERALADFGLPPAEDTPLPDWAQQLPLPLGLHYADQINTVSQGYAQEILTPSFGAGLEGFLQTRAEDIHGIRNGLDMDHWDPETDPSIFANFESGEFEKRRQNKINLLEKMDLDVDPERPLLAMINRIDYQKGVDMVPPALRVLPEGDWQILILGTGDPELEQQIRGLDQDLPQVRSVLRYDETLARWMYAGADMMIIPSRYEPCGLTQMIAMRYGCVPVARATGGLKDTIGDYDAEPVSQSTGFLFQEPTYNALATAIWRALEVFRDKRRWRGLQRRGMRKDFSWERSARKYWQLYKKLVQMK